MNTLRITFTAAAIVALSAFIAGTAAAQDDGNSVFEQRVDSIVQRVFDSVDRELGTYIFLNEPPPPDSTAANVTVDIHTDNEEILTIHSHPRRYSWADRSAYDFPNRFKPNSTLWYPWENLQDDILFRYNRVQGLFLGLNNPKSYAWFGHHIELFGSGGYGFAEHRWRYDGGLAEQFGGGDHLFEFGGEGHSLTDTDDKWLIGQSENTVSSIIARDDYRDYFEREGFSAFFGLHGRPSLARYSVQIAYLNDRYSSLNRMTNWSVFGGDKTFRDNPMIDDGFMHSIAMMLEMEHLRQDRIFTTGWTAAFSAEVAGQNLGGDFRFNRYMADIRRYQPFSNYDNLNLRVRAGSATGELPLQKSFALGGISTLPAFSYKEFFGNRLLLANAEYVVNGAMFDDDEFFPSWFLRNINLIAFFDAGFITSSADASAFNGFDQVNSSTIKSDWGFAFGTRDAKLRLGFAWRTDLAGPAHIFLRLDRPF